MPTFGIQGLDVSGHQPSVDWQQQWNMGARFAYVKATEGNYYTNPSYGSQYQGSRSVGMIRGAYHFAIPNWSSGADQARYFVQNGGGWSADGYTMPPVLDFEFNPYEGRTINGFYFGNTCYNMSPAQLQSWVRDFGNTMQSLTGRLPVIYTNTSWWNQCLGNPAGFGDYPLWVAAYPSSPTNNAGPVPTASWGTYSIWQYSSTGPFAGDSNVWNGDYTSLKTFAGGQPPLSLPSGATPISGRWYGDGKSYGGWTLNGYWCLQYPMGSPWCFWFGNAGDKPVVGDWDGNGFDTIGIVRNGSWQLSNSISRLSVDKVMYYGLGSDTAVTGDWDGDGVTNIGIVRNAMWNTTISTSMYPPVSYAFYFGNVGDNPLPGDWNGDGRTGVGVVRKGSFYMSNGGTGVDYAFNFGNPTDTPVAGDWDASRTTTVGIVRSGVWQLSNSLTPPRVDIIFQ
ncbi:MULTISPECIES: lysozyme [unclassified Arthrobacter]|uniref:lysozyme n=1 Tax=unclassified Arthrobacter TaxID=235627 RepID=UPI0027D29DC4|nr:MULTISPECIES: lysozyme [unclassified Arthrobacter]